MVNTMADLNFEQKFIAMSIKASGKISEESDSIAALVKTGNKKMRIILSYDFEKDALNPELTVELYPAIYV